MCSRIYLSEKRTDSDRSYLGSDCGSREQHNFLLQEGSRVGAQQVGSFARKQDAPKRQATATAGPVTRPSLKKPDGGSTRGSGGFVERSQRRNCRRAGGRWLGFLVGLCKVCDPGTLQDSDGEARAGCSRKTDGINESGDESKGRGRGASGELGRGGERG